MVEAEGKKLARVQAMKAWVSGGVAPLIISLVIDPCSTLVEVSSQVHTPADLTIERPHWVPSSRLHPMIGYTAVSIGYLCHKK